MKKKKEYNWLLFGILTIIAIFTSLYVLKCLPGGKKMFFRRCEIIFLLYAFFCLHCFFEVNSIYETMHKYRWIIYFALLVFFVANCLNLSSLGMFDVYIQNGKGSEFINPLFGRSRAIRSDEWMVNVPRVLSGTYFNYSGINDVVNATRYNSLVATGSIIRDYAILADPSKWGYLLFGAEYGLSFFWGYKLIYGFAFWYELFLILTKNKRLLSIFGTSLVWFSTFNMWWSIVNQLISGAAILVLFFYFLKSKNSYIRLLIGMALAIAGADYCMNLYPAWQVPMGYIILSIMIWMIITEKPWKTFCKKDWLFFAVDVAFMLSIILRYLQVDATYMEAIQKTVYPGSRVSYGGNSIKKLLGYFYVLFASLWDIDNPCEIGCFPVGFPLAYILMADVLFKEKKKNNLLFFLFVPLVILTCYCTFELPKIIAKVLLLTYSIPARAVDYLGLLLVIILIVCLSEVYENKVEINLLESTIIVLISVCPAIAYSVSYTSQKREIVAIIFVGILAIISLISILSKVDKKYFNFKISTVFVSVCLTLNAMLVNPIMVGVDVILSKPAAKKVQEIAKKDHNGKWIALDSLASSNFLIACGAPTINSTNFIPNFGLWKKLDPDNKYEEVWNRYAHMAVSLSQTDESEFLVRAGDFIACVLSEEDLKKTGVKYLFSQSEIMGSWEDMVTEIYHEDNVYIYQINYNS